VKLYGDDVFGGLSNLFAKVREEKFVNSIYKQFGMGVKEGTFKCQEIPEGMSFLGAKCRAFWKRGVLYFAPAYNRNRILAALQRSIDPLLPHEELMKVFSLMEIGWFDCHDELSQYASFLLRRIPDSTVKAGFLRRGIKTREEIRDDWADVSGSD